MMDGLPRGGVDGTAEQPLRILFSLLHPGYLRHYAEPIRILGARGHELELVLHQGVARGPGIDPLLASILADCPSVRASSAPRRHRLDGWRAIAWIVRSLVDVVRYSEPRYREADALRRRASWTMRERVERGGVDPVSRHLVRGLVAWAERARTPRRLAQTLSALAAVEASIPVSRRTTAFIEAKRPDLVLATPLVEFASPQVEFVKSARRLRIPCAVCVASWDNLTNKGLLRVVPDRVLVWNERQRQELAEMHRVPPDRVVVTGAQRFDRWFELAPSTSREEFARRAGLEPGRPFVLYVCSSRFVAPDEVTIVRRWIRAVRGSGGPLDELGILVRPHPQNAVQWQNADLSELANVAVWPRDGEHPDEAESQSRFFDSIFHSAAVVGVSTSAQIEAGIIGRPVLTVVSPELAATQTGTLHFQYLREENGGFVREAADLETHVTQLASVVGGSEESGRIEGFIDSFVRPRGRTVPAAGIVADELEAVARLRVEPEAPGVARLLVRTALTPVALVLSALAAASAVAARLRRGA